MLGSSVRSRLHRHGLLFSGSQFPAAQPVGHQECSVERCLAVFPSRTYQTLTKEDVHEPAEHLPGPFRVFFGAVSPLPNRSVFEAARHCVGAVSAALPAAVTCVPWTHSGHFNIPVYPREQRARSVPPHPEFITLDAVHPGFPVAMFNRHCGRSSKLCR